MGHHWILARTKPARESWAAENISKQGFNFYLPKFQEPTRLNVGGQHIRMQRPRYLFPSYIFVRTDGLWRFLLGTFGITGVVLRGQAPDVVPEGIIDQIRAREDQDGFVSLPQRQRGQPVRIINGPFRDREGIYLGESASGRVRILLEVLGRQSRTLFASEDVASVY